MNTKWSQIKLENMDPQVRVTGRKPTMCCFLWPAYAHELEIWPVVAFAKLTIVTHIITKLSEVVHVGFCFLKVFTVDFNFSQTFKYHGLNHYMASNYGQTLKDLNLLWKLKSCSIQNNHPEFLLSCVIDWPTKFGELF